MNRVTIPSDPEVSALQRIPDKTYDLLAGDKFWGTHRGSPFPTVADAVQAELNEYKASEEEVMKLKKVMDVSEEGDPDAVSGALTDNTAKLSSAIRSALTPVHCSISLPPFFPLPSSLSLLLSPS